MDEIDDIGPPSFSHSQILTLEIVTGISAGIGALGAIATCCAYLYWKHMRTAIARIVFFMAISDFVASISMAFGQLGPISGTNNPFCQLQAAGMQWGDISSILWTGMISINLIWIMYRGRAVDDIQKYERRHLIICYAAPLIWAIVPIFIYVDGTTRIYGNADLWCWVTPRLPTAQIILFYGPLWIVFLFNFVTYLAVGRLIWQRAHIVARGGDSNGANSYRYTYGKNVSLYLLAFLLVWTPATLNRIYTFAFHGERSYALNLMHGIMTSSRGMINCLVYCYITWYSQIRATSSMLRENDSAHITAIEIGSYGWPHRPHGRTNLDTSIQAGAYGQGRGTPSEYNSAMAPTNAVAAASLSSSASPPNERGYKLGHARRPSQQSGGYRTTDEVLFEESPVLMESPGESSNGTTSHQYDYNNTGQPLQDGSGRTRRW
ncbi:slime mold cyclic AMP receptor-domain-containing protein [Syncephalis fuscata]|nr:slime mold cyclic AMP receptor-domain-containing protein [Syncephalis fuscata]